MRALTIFTVAILAVAVIFTSSISVFAGSTVNTIPEKPANSFVSDIANMLSTGTESDVIQRNTQLDDETMGIYVLTVNGTGEDTLEDFAKKVFVNWEIGGETSSGILFLINKNTSVDENETYYVLVGEGLDDYFGNDVLRDFMEDEVEPVFAEGDYDDAVDTFVKNCVETITGIESVIIDTTPIPGGVVEGDKDDEEKDIWGIIFDVIKTIFLIILLLAAIVIILLIMLNIRAQKIRQKRRTARKNIRKNNAKK